MFFKKFRRTLDNHSRHTGGEPLDYRDQTNGNYVNKSGIPLNEKLYYFPMLDSNGDCKTSYQVYIVHNYTAQK